MYQINGTMKQIEEKIEQLKNKYKLPLFLDIKIEEDHFDPTITDRLEALRKHLAVEGKMKIINNRIIYKDKPAARFSTSYSANDLNDLKPEKVVKDLISGRDETEQSKLLAIFSAVYADVIQS